MSDFTDAVDAGLKGLTAVSTGVCPGCNECREQHGFTVAEEDDCLGVAGFVCEADAGAHFGTEAECAIHAQKCFQAAWESGKICDEGSFSWSSCGICNSRLGGDRFDWHGLDDLTGTLYHFDDACVDCVLYLANGDEPESWS
jgi:hypothetical protein